MQINVKLLTGITIKLEVQPSDTVLSVKHMLRALGAKHSNYPLLLDNGTPMEEAQPLSKYNVKPQTSMKLAAKPGKEHNLLIWSQDENVYP